MIRLIPFLMTCAFIILCSIILVQIIDSYLIPKSVTPTNPAYDVQESMVDHLEARNDSSPLKSVTPSPDMTQTPPLVDGRSLMDNYCSQCHLAQWLEDMEKPRSEWVNTLQRMELMGVQLDEDQKEILLDYLSSSGEG
jgi:hypothetical protein